MSTEIKAQNSMALASVKAIYEAAEEANNLLDGMQTAAEEAGTTLDGIYADAEQAKTSAESASEYAARALGNLSTVQSVAETLNWITSHGTMTLTTDTALDPSHVYFVADPNGDYTVGGNRYSVVTEPNVADISTYYELSIDESLNNYVATHLVVDSEGLWIIPDTGGNKVLIATGQGSTYTSAGTYIVGKVNDVDTVLAQFTADGVQIGQNKNGESRTNITEDGLQIVHKNPYGVDVQIAQLGYSGGSTYTTLGERKSESTIGAYSLAEGRRNTASGACSHAEGYLTNATGDYSHAEGSENLASGAYSHTEGEGTTASGDNSHAEGKDTTASGNKSHAEGDHTTASGNKSHAEGDHTTASGVSSHVEGRGSEASGDNSHAEGEDTTASGENSHAEGNYTIASGINSHAQNYFTIAQRRSQTVLGEYNIADTGGTDETTRGDYAVIIGNGTSDVARSNGLAVTWDGNVEMALDTSATSGTDKEIYDALVSLGWDSDVIV